VSLQPLDERVDREAEEERDEQPDEHVARNRDEMEECPDDDRQAEDRQNRAHAKADDALGHDGEDPRQAGRSFTFRGLMSLRDTPIEQELTLADGREAVLLIGMANDSYLPPREEETVVVELRIGRHVEATVNTVLDPDQDEEAGELARELIAGLGAGRIPPTAAALEQYADRLR
jgi:hypothetical protein